MRSTWYDRVYVKIPLEVKLKVQMIFSDKENWSMGEYLGEADKFTEVAIDAVLGHLLNRLSIEEINNLNIVDRTIVDVLNGRPVFESDWHHAPRTPVEVRCWERERRNLIKTFVEDDVVR